MNRGNKAGRRLVMCYRVRDVTTDASLSGVMSFSTKLSHQTSFVRLNTIIG